MKCKQIYYKIKEREHVWKVIGWDVHAVDRITEPVA